MATFERMLLAKKPIILNERFEVVRRLGGGSFGDIYLAQTGSEVDIILVIIDTKLISSSYHVSLYLEILVGKWPSRVKLQ